MQYKYLGRTGIKVSQLCLGTMTFGAEADEDTSAALFSMARDAGINCFDCADIYAQGRSESILGELMASCRDEIVLASKCYFPNGDDVNARGASRYHLIAAVESSLRRLKTDRIDLYYVHHYDSHTHLDETLRALDDLVSEGKILYPAASNFSAWQTVKATERQRAAGWARLACIQPMYNLLKRQAEVEILPMAAHESLGVFTYSPLAGGLLSGKYAGAKKPQAARLRDNPMYRTRYADSDYFTAAEKFSQLVGQWGLPATAVAIAWVAAHPAVTAAIVGARSKHQLADCLHAATLELTEERYQALCQLTPEPPLATDRGEERTRENYHRR